MSVSVIHTPASWPYKSELSLLISQALNRLGKNGQGLFCRQGLGGRDTGRCCCSAAGLIYRLVVLAAQRQLAAHPSPQHNCGRHGDFSLLTK